VKETMHIVNPSEERKCFVREVEVLYVYLFGPAFAVAVNYISKKCSWKCNLADLGF